MFRTAIETEIEIGASPEVVWQVLTNFTEYPQWNPFVVQISGELVVGKKLKATIQPQGSKAMTFTPTVCLADAGRGFRWMGQLWKPGIMDGEHSFVLEPAGPGRTRFVHSERFNGVLVPLILAIIRAKTTAGFVAMNEALKLRAEQLASR
jgi:hypothetical protein